MDFLIGVAKALLPQHTPTPRHGVQGVITSSDAGDKGFAAGGKRGVKGEIISSAESEEEGVKGMFSSVREKEGVKMFSSPAVGEK